MRKWLSMTLVRLATKLRPENRDAQEYFMKLANEHVIKSRPEVEVSTTWEVFIRDMERNRGFFKTKFIYGVRRGLKTEYRFATYGDQVTTFPKTEHLTPAQLYREGYPIEEETKIEEGPYASKGKKKTEEHRGDTQG